MTAEPIRAEEAGQVAGQGLWAEVRSSFLLLALVLLVAAGTTGLGVGLSALS